MTTTVDKSLVIPWDHFLTQQAGKAGYENLREHIEVFRHTEWPNIIRDLAREPHWGPGQEPTYWEIADNLEPHWVSSGKAIYWQERQVRERRIIRTDGIPSVEITWRSEGWHPAGPFPANNAGQIAHYLAKGLRLRPPEQGVTAEARLEAAIPSEGFAPEKEEPKPQFFCERHGLKPRGFLTWKGYIKHCYTFKERPTLMPPDEVAQRAAKFQYFCMIHDKGFNHARHAQQHLTAEVRRNKNGGHPTIEEMKIQNNSFSGGS